MSTATIGATDLHPLQVVAGCVRQMEAALDQAPYDDLPAGDVGLLEAVIADAARVESRLAELRLRLGRCAETSRAAEQVAASGADAWLARLTGSNATAMRGGLWLARLLSERYPSVRDAFAAGDLSEAHARIIVRTAEQMPTPVTVSEREEAVSTLVEKVIARRMSPKSLRRSARRMLDSVSRAHADQHEKDLLTREERQAELDASFTMHDNGDGSWSGRFCVPDLAARMLQTVLEHLSSPRRTGRNPEGRPVTDPTIAALPTGYAGLSWSERLGQAFTELCEHLPTDGLSNHGRNNATVVVHVDLAHLHDGLASAAVAGTGSLTAGQARRLACEAGIIPAILDSDSVPLDLGREQRLHSKHQRIALSARYDTCAAEGCERPFAWCEVHHPIPWSRGGDTDLSGIPLCGWHHRRAHDDRYDMRQLRNGDVRYRRRR